MEDKNGSAWRVIGWLLLSLLAVLVFCTTVIPTDPKWVYPYLGVQNKHEALKSMGFVFAGVILIIQAFIANRRAKAMEKAANAQAAATKAQAKATKEQAKANQNTEQGQRQERLKNAIEHLGHEKVSVRLGGAYELFHLARDSKEEEKELRQTVLDILCAHIRQTTCEGNYQKDYKSKPSEEIQSLLTLLFVRPHDVFERLYINLQESWLNGAQLSYARLQRAHLTKAQLQGTILAEARLQGAFLSEAQMRGAYLVRAQLHGATLSDAQLQGANLGRALLHGASLGMYTFGAQLQGVNLAAAQLQGAIISGAQLQGAHLRGAQLQGVTRQEQGIAVPFEDRIREGIGRRSDLSYVIFAGGLSQQDLDSFVEGLSEEKTKKLQERLTPHVGKSPCDQLLENSGAITGAYTAEEADKWIAEYNEATKDIED